MPYKVAGIDVHKRMLHVVVSDVQVDGESRLRTPQQIEKSESTPWRKLKHSLPLPVILNY
jgi:hypothetical protein